MPALRPPSKPISEGPRSMLPKVGFMMSSAPIKAPTRDTPWTGESFSFSRKKEAMTAKQVLTLVTAGLFAAGGQFSVTAAYCCAPAKEISVYDYSQIIFSTLLGFFIFGDVPDGLSVLGYFLICGMAVLNFWHSNRSSRKPS